MPQNGQPRVQPGGSTLSVTPTSQIKSTGSPSCSASITRNRLAIAVLLGPFGYAASMFSAPLINDSTL
jgi:hypothetical protein